MRGGSGTRGRQFDGDGCPTTAPLIVAAVVARMANPATALGKQALLIESDSDHSNGTLQAARAAPRCRGRHQHAQHASLSHLLACISKSIDGKERGFHRRSDATSRKAMATKLKKQQKKKRWEGSGLSVPDDLKHEVNTRYAEQGRAGRMQAGDAGWTPPGAFRLLRRRITGDATTANLMEGHSILT